MVGMRGAACAALAAIVAWSVFVPPAGNSSLYSRVCQGQIQMWARGLSDGLLWAYSSLVDIESLVAQPLGAAFGLPHWFMHAEFWLDIGIKNLWLHWYDPQAHDTPSRKLYEKVLDHDTCRILLEIAEKHSSPPVGVEEMTKNNLGPHAQVLQATHRSVYSFDDLNTLSEEHSAVAYGVQNMIHNLSRQFFGIDELSIYSASLVTRYRNTYYSEFLDRAWSTRSTPGNLDKSPSHLEESPDSLEEPPFDFLTRSFRCPSVLSSFGLCRYYYSVVISIDTLFSGGLNLHCDSHEFRKLPYFGRKTAKMSPQYYERTHSALLYLDTEEELSQYSGGEIFFIHHRDPSEPRASSEPSASPEPTPGGSEPTPGGGGSEPKGYATDRNPYFAYFSDLLFGRIKLRPACGNLLLYTGDERNVHGVRPVFGEGRRHSLAIWFTSVPHIDPSLTGSASDGTPLREIAKAKQLEKCLSVRPEGAPDCEHLISRI